MTAAYGLDARVKELTRTHLPVTLAPGIVQAGHGDTKVLGCAGCIAEERVGPMLAVLDNVRPAPDDWRNPDNPGWEARHLLAALDLAAHEGMMVFGDMHGTCLTCWGGVPGHAPLPPLRLRDRHERGCAAGVAPGAACTCERTR